MRGQLHSLADGSVLLVQVGERWDLLDSDHRLDRLIDVYFRHIE